MRLPPWKSYALATALACLAVGCGPAATTPTEGIGAERKRNTFTFNPNAFLTLAPGDSAQITTGGTTTTASNTGPAYGGEISLPTGTSVTLTSAKASSAGYVGPSLIETVDGHAVSVQPGTTLTFTVADCQSTSQLFDVTGGGGLWVSNGQWVAAGNPATAVRPITVKSNHTTTAVYGSSFDVVYVPGTDSVTISLFDCNDSPANQYAVTAVTANGITEIQLPYSGGKYPHGVQVSLTKSDGTGKNTQTPFTSTGTLGSPGPIATVGGTGGTSTTASGSGGTTGKSVGNGSKGG